MYGSIPLIRSDSDFDFAGLRTNNSLNRLLEANGEVVMKDDPFYSDVIVRINSFEQRKVRVIVITRHHMFILIQEGKHQFKIKTDSKLEHIYKIEAAVHNALLVNILFKNRYSILTLGKAVN